jgi:Transposase DDE domain
MLQRVGGVNPDGRQLYRAPASICNDCPVKGQCTTSNQGRRVYRHVGEEYLERVRTYQHTLAYQKALRKRQVWVDVLATWHICSRMMKEKDELKSHSCCLRRQRRDQHCITEKRV